MQGNLKRADKLNPKPYTPNPIARGHCYWMRTDARPAALTEGLGVKGLYGNNGESNEKEDGT